MIFKNNRYFMWQISRQQLQISISLLKNESDTNEKEIIRQNWVRYGSFTV